ncbi:hypothetical protein [Brevundimonas sp.]|uniref:hypothetical protein n=1 Tax=Brevundimonas sp. TaxID=1871086 RepID=UPI003F718676
MLFPVVLFASLALIQQTPATAPTQPTAEAVPAANATRPVAEPAQVCRTEPVTGSRFGRRVCRSAAQTEEDRAASREMLRQMQGARVPPSG